MIAITANWSGIAVPKMAPIAGATQAKPPGCLEPSAATYVADASTTATCHTSTTFSHLKIAGRMTAMSRVKRARRSNQPYRPS